MATVESWGGTIADIGPIYPMVGTEGLLVVIGVVLWIAWHVICRRSARTATTRSRSGSTGVRNHSNGSLPKRTRRIRSRGAINPDPSSRCRGALEPTQGQDDAALTSERRARSRCARIALEPRSASRFLTASNISRCCML